MPWLLMPWLLVESSNNESSSCVPRPSPAMELTVEQTSPCLPLRPRQNGRRFADDTFKRIFLNEHIRISTKNSLKFDPKVLINNIPALVLIMAWRRPGDKSLSEPMLVRSLTHICVTWPQWVNSLAPERFELNSRFAIFKLKSIIDRQGISCKIPLR